MDIVIEDLEYVYSPGTPMELKALQGVSLRIPAGSALAILGASGSGKTTLLKNLNGLLIPTAGHILIDGKDIRRFGPELRKRAGLVCQQPERQVFEKTVFLDISFALRHFSAMSHEEIRQRVAAAAQLVGLDLDAVGDRPPWTLSDGEKRRVAMAGVLANDPEILILDEPTIGLGPQSVETVLNLIEGFRRDKSHTVVIVSHQIDAFLEQIDKIAVLDRGTLAAYGTPAEVCEMLGENPALRPLLPELALLIHDLRRRGFDLPRDEYNLRTLAKEILGLSERSKPTPRAGVPQMDKVMPLA
uniref:ATP-binding cassette domain-containing protein n=1 Tax=Desulfomonile tiedjei TaxID=2358 RepID=A0A7C4ASM1_9BACT